MVIKKASLRKGGCQPKADWRVVSAQLIYIAALPVVCPLISGFPGSGTQAGAE